jgi:aminopeptidase YwaD
VLRPLLDLLAAELSGQNCLDHVQTITRYHRIQASPGYRAAADECLQILKRGGVAARVTSYPATGRNWHWTSLTPQEWACRDAELWLLGPDGERIERLAWFDEMNLSIIQRSCATPAEGVSAELVVIADALNPASWAAQAVAGKIALVGNGDIHRMLQLARSYGAAGLVTARMSYDPPTRPVGDLADALQYTSFWWSEDEEKGWGFVLSTRQGERLKQLAGNGPIRLWARVDASFADGSIENVEAVIPGATAEEVLVISHLCHPKPSANDNATGPATVMETARTLQKLIASGQLPQPRRTIRFLHPPEMTGTYAHLAALAPEERTRVVAALNVDMVGQKQEATGSVLICEYPPMACPSFAGDLMALILGEVARETTPLAGFGTKYARFRHAVTAFSGGSDHYIAADPTVGIPCPMIIQWPDRFYHTSADTIDKVDPAMMQRVGMLTGAYAYFLANAGVREAGWLAAEMAALFPAQLHGAVGGSPDPAAAVGFRVERKLADLDSLRRLVAPGPEEAELEPLLALCRHQVELAADLELQRTHVLAPAASAAAVMADVEPTTTPGWTRPADLQAIRPARVHPGPISLRHYLPRLTASEADSWRAFAAAHPAADRMADYLGYWADGWRTLADICRLTYLETGLHDDIGALGYCQLLARLGLVTGV